MVVVDSEWAEMFQILFAHFFSLEYSVSQLCDFICGTSQKLGSELKGTKTKAYSNINSDQTVEKQLTFWEIDKNCTSFEVI